jgi:amidase
MRRAQIMQLVVPGPGPPAAAVPPGGADGVPTGVQITAGRFWEDLCLETAAAIEARAPMATPDRSPLAVSAEAHRGRRPTR